MFNRESRTAEHRQHMRPPTSPGYTFEAVGTPGRTAARIDTLRSIVQNGQHEEIDGMIVDLQTANLLIQIYEKGNDNTKNLIDTAPLEKVVGAAWKLTSGRKTSGTEKVRGEAQVGDLVTYYDIANQSGDVWVVVGDEETESYTPSGISLPGRGYELRHFKDGTPHWSDLRQPGWTFATDFDLGRNASRKTSAVTWYDQSDQFGGMWSTYQGSAPDSPNGQISESNGTYRWYVSDSGTRGNQQTGESSSLEEAKREAESALASLGVTASKTASRRTAFLDSMELPETRHRVAGWDWDDHLNGFIAAEAAREFTCACGENIPAPGYTDCRCGKRWNAYSIQSNGSKKMIAREIPVRENVVMARTAHRKATRKQAASSPSEVISQHFSGWQVDDDDGDFWEIQSPGGEHAFIHEGGDVYTVLINDATSREVYETGLTFDEALEEFRAEGVI